ncbi:MAG: FdhF/YdeP family oxidoreductase, partial [Planctomycetota bacterium]
NNLPDCSNMCHESSGVALSETIGVGKGTVTLADFYDADCIFILGQNPGTNHPRMLSMLQAAARRGAQIVTMNPLIEPGLVKFLHPQEPLAMATNRGTPLTTDYLQPTIGGDLAALKGMCKVVVERDALDHTFIDEQTIGFADLAADLAQTDWAEIETQSGLKRADIERIAATYIDAERTIICWAMGLTQHKHAVPTLQMVVNLLLLRGNIGKPGAGACPVRGHSNVQGDRTVGIFHVLKKPLREGLKRTFGFDPPTDEGHDVVGAINAMSAGRARVFIGMGGNFADATPDSPRTHAALARCDLTVHVSTKLNRSHTVVGKCALILPCLGRTERDVQASGPQRVTVEDSMSMVHASQGKNAPASPHLRSEPAIVAGIARATFDADDIPWHEMAGNYDLIRTKLAETLPEVFHDYNARIAEPGGFYLGNTARDQRWATASGKAVFTTHAIPDLTLPPGQLRLMTMRSHDQYNTTVYGNDDRYRGIKGKRRVLFLNPDDLAERGLGAGDIVQIESHFDDGVAREVSGFEVVPYDLPRGCAAGYFPELNPLVSVDSFAERSRTPTSKLIPITVRV